MSTLIVEVCKIHNIRRHPAADRLAVALVKGWQVVIGYNPSTQQADFAEGDLCIYFPPDSILSPELANSPYKVCKNKDCELFNKTEQQSPEFVGEGDCLVCGSALQFKHGTPGRTGARDFAAELPVDEITGEKPLGCRLRAARLRGMQSFGLVIKIDPSYGDDPSWTEGIDVKDFFGVTKWEPPLSSQEGDSELEHVRFHKYTEIEHFANYPDSIDQDTEIIITEKIHGKNTRVGLILDADENGVASWQLMAGSHDNRRKEWFKIYKRFDVDDLIAAHIITESKVEVGQIFSFGYKDGDASFWKVDELRPTNSIDLDTGIEITKLYFRAESVHEDGTPIFRQSDFWSIIDNSIKSLLEDIRSNFDFHEPKTGIVIFAELYGSGVQDLNYGLKDGVKAIRVFDIAINFKYLSFDIMNQLCQKHKVTIVPVLYRGKFSKAKVEELTSGPTTIGSPKDISSKFKGREGIVIKPVVEQITEQMMLTSTNGRVILKSLSADYLSRSNATDSH